MATVTNVEVRRYLVTATKPNPGTEVKAVIPVPNGIANLTLLVSGSTAATAKVEETYSDGAAIQGGTAVWRQVDASLDSVGTTAVRYALNHTPVALRLSSLVDNATATMIVVGRQT